LEPAIQARDCPLASRADPAELGFRVKALGFGVSGVGLRVDLFWVSDLGFRILALRFRR
jgi:hypothetical protein